MFRDLELLTGQALLLLVLLPALLALAIPYAVLALRDSRSVVRDPQVGWKAVLYFTFSLCILMALFAVTLLVFDFLTTTSSTPRTPALTPATAGGPGFLPSPRRSPSPPLLSEQQRTAFAILTSAVLVGLVHLFLILFGSNSRRFPAARRVFVGSRLAVHSLVVLGAFTVLVYQLYQPSVDIDHLKIPFAILIVWVPSWLCHLVLLRAASSSEVPSLGRGFPSVPPGSEE
jgi:hypothetical protein